MKKLISTVIATAMICTISTNALAAPQIGANKERILALQVNGETIAAKVPPLLFNDRTLVPARDVFEKLGANVDWNGEMQKVTVAHNSMLVELKIDDNTAIVNGSKVSMDVPAKIIDSKTMIPVRFVAEQLNMKVGWDENQGLVKIDNSSLSSVSVEATNEGEVAIIALDYYQKVNVFTLINPKEPEKDRIVVDFPNVLSTTSLEKIDVKGTAIKSVRYTHFEDSTGYKAARIVLDVNPAVKYNVEKKDGRVLVFVKAGEGTPNRGEGEREEPSKPTPNPSPVPTPTPVPKPTPNPTPTPSPTPTPTPSLPLPVQDKQPVTIPEPGSNYKNITYNYSGDRVFFKLSEAVLASVPSQNKKDFTESYENSGKRYIMTFKTSQADLGTGVMKINDNLIDSVKIQRDEKKGTATLIFDCKVPLVFETLTRYNYNNNNYIDTVINVIKPYSKDNKLVVIDPGHGGFELGAAYNGVYEKNLNLDIAKRVNNILKEKGANTYILRTDDTYIDLYERAYIANKLNATLFISIHNNAFNGAAYGTESLYNNVTSGPVNSKVFAQNLQNWLIPALGSYNRGVIERPGLVVLNRTQMVASLVEVGFIDNKDELSNLLSENYRQKAAQAIADAIRYTLSQIK